MSNRPCHLNGLRLETSRAAPHLSAFRDDTRVWSRTLDAWGPALIPRIQKPMVVAAHVLVQTDGEHPRGATSHDPRAYLFDGNGKLLWWRHWRLEGPIHSHHGDLLVLVMRTPYRVAIDGPVAWVLRVRLRDGSPREVWPLRFDLQTMTSLNACPWPSVQGAIHKKGKVPRALLSATWDGGKAQLKVPLEPRGRRPEPNEVFVST